MTVNNTTDNMVRLSIMKKLQPLRMAQTPFDHPALKPGPSVQQAPMDRKSMHAHCP
jgi:hypothetical protein